MARLSKRQWMIRNTLSILVDVSVLLASLIVVFPSAWPFLLYQSPIVLFPFLQLPISQLIACIFVSLTVLNALINTVTTFGMNFRKRTYKHFLPTAFHLSSFTYLFGHIAVVTALFFLSYSYLNIISCIAIASFVYLTSALYSLMGTYQTKRAKGKQNHWYSNIKHILFTINPNILNERLPISTHTHPKTHEKRDTSLFIKNILDLSPYPNLHDCDKGFNIIERWMKENYFSSDNKGTHKLSDIINEIKAFHKSGIDTSRLIHALLMTKDEKQQSKKVTNEHKGLQEEVLNTILSNALAYQSNPDENTENKCFYTMVKSLWVSDNGTTKRTIIDTAVQYGKKELLATILAHNGFKNGTFRSDGFFNSTRDTHRKPALFYINESLRHKYEKRETKPTADAVKKLYSDYTDLGNSQDFPGLTLFATTNNTSFYEQPDFLKGVCNESTTDQLKSYFQEKKEQKTRLDNFTPEQKPLLTNEQIKKLEKILSSSPSELTKRISLFSNEKIPSGTSPGLLSHLLTGDLVLGQ